jgi:hypothetical protein
VSLVLRYIRSAFFGVAKMIFLSGLKYVCFFFFLGGFLVTFQNCWGGEGGGYRQIYGYWLQF